jgi:hypothetical protein
VWLDETLRVARGITAGIEEQLNASKIMLVLYSAAYSASVRLPVGADRGISSG